MHVLYKLLCKIKFRNIIISFTLYKLLYHPVLILVSPCITVIISL